MPRIYGVNVPENKAARISLTYIYGIGRSVALDILKKAKVEEDKKMKDLTPDELSKIRKLVDEEAKTEGELRRERRENVERLKRIGSYRGDRHKKRLPARGQNTRTNSRTVRGNVRMTAGSGRIKAPSAK